MQIPIACTLSSSDARTQLQEWREVVARSVTSWEQPEATSLRLQLANGLEHVTEVLKLAQKEKNCCGFFAFALEIEASQFTFTISVPSEGTAVLEGFVSEALRGPGVSPAARS